MASPIRRAQAVIPCQLCDGTEVLRWRCKTCDLLLCENCKVNRHLRVKGADKHYVISIKDVGMTNVDYKNMEDVTGMFASLEISQPREINTKVVSFVEHTYTTDLPGVHRIVCFDDDKVCYVNNRINKVITAKLLRASIKVLNVKNQHVMDITFNERNELMTCLSDTKSELKILEKNNPITVYDCSPLIILSMHYNKKTNELFLGARDSGPKYQVTQYSTRPVIILGPGYKRKTTVEFSTDGKRLFTYPACIDTGDDDKIYVNNWFDDEHHGRVVAVSRDGGLKFTYSGYKQFNTSDFLFNPEGIAVTHSNHLAIVDCRNHSLHVLQTDGQLIGLQDTKEVRILLPMSLCIDTKGFLLIGCNTYDDEPEQAKIHVVKLSV